MINWEARYKAAELFFQKLKSITKRVPASTWTPEYKELAEAIHSAGRDAFYVEE